MFVSMLACVCEFDERSKCFLIAAMWLPLFIIISTYTRDGKNRREREEEFGEACNLEKKTPFRCNFNGVTAFFRFLSLSLLFTCTQATFFCIGHDHYDVLLWLIFHRFAIYLLFVWFLFCKYTYTQSSTIFSLL